MHDGCNLSGLEKIDRNGVEDHCFGIRMDHRNHLPPLYQVSAKQLSATREAVIRIEKTEGDHRQLLYLRLSLKQFHYSNRQFEKQPISRSNYDNKT